MSACPAIRSIEEAWSFIERAVSPVQETETIGLCDAKHRVLSGDCVSKIDVPRYRHSAMDGFSMDFETALVGQQPLCMPILGSVEPGVMTSDRHPAGAIRVFTGSILPTDAYAVMRDEDCRTETDAVVIEQVPTRGENIREVGEDVAAGTIILRPGVRLGDRELALAAAAGCSELSVYRKPRALIVATGNELALPAGPPKAGQIFDSNGIMTRAMLEDLGFDTSGPHHVPDSLSAIRDLLVAPESDLVVLSGGMSRSETDYSVRAIGAAGGVVAELDLKLKPGKPARVGFIGRTAVVGLPGNPFAAFVAMKVLGEVAARRISGVREIRPRRMFLDAGFSYVRQSRRDEFLPGKVVTTGTRSVAVRIGVGGSARLMPLSLAEGLCRLTSDKLKVSDGTKIEWWPF